MNTKKNESQGQNENTSQGFYAQPRAFLSKNGEYLTLALPGNMYIRKHVNWFKAILGVAYSPVAPKGNEPKAVA